MSHYASILMNFLKRGRELGSHFITKVLEGIKRLSGYTENLKSPFSSSDLKRAFQYLGGVEMNLTNSRLKMILVASFMGFLRFSEVSNLKRSDFSFFITLICQYSQKKLKQTFKGKGNGFI